MQYPQFPIPEEHPLPKSEYPKDALKDIMVTYDELKALGLQPIPKQRESKLPVWSFWRKESNPDYSRANIYKFQGRSTVAGWCIPCGEISNRLLVIDIDTHEMIKNGNDPAMTYEKIQSLSSTGFVLRTPANGVHMYYRVPEDREMLTNSAPPIKGLDQRGEGGFVTSLHGYNRYDNTPESSYADHKGVVDGHTDSYRKMPFGNYSYIPVMDDALYEWLTSDRPEKRSKTSEQIKGENYGKTGMGLERVEKHFKQSPDDRERIVIECLTLILENWNEAKTYDQWLQLWMAAHHGSDGSIIVRDMLLEGDNVYWSDGATGRRHFRQAWEEHIPSEDGFSVASLFYLARQLGWLSETGYEVVESLGEPINVRYISQWLDTELNVPRRIALKSQTGSGKTWTIRNLWDRLGKPKGVVFCPTIKLATELTFTLINEHGIPATLYIDDETQKIKPLEVLAKAEFLVTTLQTFATKVFKHVDMKDYGLVYVEESDQLINQFSRGGGGVYGTHVSDHEARSGFETLRAAMDKSGCVWFVDATMTKISYFLAEALRNGHELRVVVNRWVEKKAPVKFVPSKGVAYQEVLKELERGGRVVVAADTKAAAVECYDTMLAIGSVSEEDAILITADTKHKNDVQQFMKDVNEGALQYKLVCYSPVIASGVSITSTAPDLIVQISGWLTPRNNLQMLNRYRKQSKVVCFYANTERLYGKKAQEIMEEAQERAWIEARNVRIPLAVRNNDAVLRAYLASVAIGDQELQLRAPKEFYIRLLQSDGRQVEWSGDEPVAQIIKHTVDGVREIKKARQDLISRTWRGVDPIDRDNPPAPDMSDIDVARGETHAYIDRCLFGNIPEHLDDREIWDVVNEFGSHGYLLDAFIKQQNTVTKAESYLADDGKAITSLANNVTMVKVVSLVRHLWDSLDDKLTYDKAKARASTFLTALDLHRDMYDTIVNRSKQKYESVLERDNDPVTLALAYSKILLSTIGLKQRSERDNRVGGEADYVYSIVNADNAIQFLEWRNQEEPEIIFSDDVVNERVEARADANEIFHKMDEHEQSKVFKRMKDYNTDFKTAVYAIHEKDKFGGF